MSINKRTMPLLTGFGAALLVAAACNTAAPTSPRRPGTTTPAVTATATLVAVTQNPTLRIGIVDDPAARGERCGNALLDLLASNGHVDVRCVS